MEPTIHFGVWIRRNEERIVPIEMTQEARVRSRLSAAASRPP